MRFVFADTSYYVALANSLDVWHTRAAALSRTNRERVLTTEFVLIELGNLMSRGADRRTFLSILGSLRQSPFVTIVASGTELLDEGLDLYSRRADEDWSITDCTSFVIMERYAVSDALTADHHFEQAGFNVLLK